MKEDPKTLALRAWNTAQIFSGSRTLHNRLRYGPNGPRPNLRLNVAPEEITDRYFQLGNDRWRIGHWRTGRVLDGDWDQSRRKFANALKFRACQKHFMKGVPWDETRAFPYGLKRIAKFGKYDDCRSEADLHARYASLDDLWRKTIAEGSLPPLASRDTTARSGIVVNIDRDGEFLFGNKGFHRLAIAKLAKLETITIVLGITHPNAISSGKFAEILDKHSL